jgi:hypothetical protein
MQFREVEQIVTRILCPGGAKLILHTAENITFKQCGTFRWHFQSTGGQVRVSIGATALPLLYMSFVNPKPCSALDLFVINVSQEARSLKAGVSLFMRESHSTVTVDLRFGNPAYA